MIELRVLGGIDVLGPHGERSRAVLAQPRRAALLVYLAVRAPRGPERRDQLARTFWPDAEPAAARQSLRQALSFLRRALGDQVIVTRGDTRGEEEVGVDPAEVRCDVTRLDALLDAGDHLRAAELYQGELLHGFPDTGLDTFERWREETADRLRLRVRRSLRALAERDAAAGQTLLAAHWARLEHAIVPTDEDAAMHLMRRLRDAGDYEGPLVVYGEVVRLLARELDDEPSPELVALMDEIRSTPGRRLAPPSTAGAAAVAVLDAAPDARARDREPWEGADLDTRLAEVPAAKPPVGAAALDGALPLTELAPTPSRPRRTLARYEVVLALCAAVFLVAGAMTLRALGVGPLGTLFAVGRMKADDLIVVADFGSPGDSTLGRAIAQGVKADLAQSRAVRVLGDEAVAGVLRRMVRADDHLTLPVAREVAVREGAEMVVDGSIASVGSGFLLTLRLVTADSAREVVAYQASVDSPGQLVGAIGQLSRKLRARIGESLREVERSPPLQHVTTASLDALRRYTEGFRAVARDGDRPRFMLMMREAIALDTTFAAAYLWLAAELNNRGGQSGEVARLLERAYALRGRLPAHDQRWVEYFYFISGPPAARDSGRAVAAALARTLDRGSRDHSNSLNNLGWTFQLRGLRAPAETTYRLAIAADTIYRYPLSNLIQLREEQGDLADLDSLVATFRRRFPRGYTGVLLASALRRGQGDLEGAEAIVRDALATERDPFSRAEYASALGLITGMGGRAREFDAANARTADARRARGVATAALDAALDRASYRALVLGDRADARRILDAVMAEHAADTVDALDRPRAAAAIAYALAGESVAARRQLDDAERQIPEGDLGQAYLLRVARAHVAIAEGRWDDAIREARLARVGRCRWCGALPLALAYDATGASDSAMAAYERTRMQAPMRRYVGDLGELAAGPVLRRLGELYEARGDTARAIDRYDRFVTLWRRADSALQPQVVEVRARVARLRARVGPGT